MKVAFLCASNSRTIPLYSCADSVLGLSELEDDEPPLDQKHLNLVHEELEKLNIATDVINKLEVQLDGARACFREIQASWSEKLKELSKKYSTAIAKARPYYEAKIQERKLRDESQRAAIRFERATSLLAVAKQQVALTQDSLNRQTTVHPECLEVLNHHIQRVNEAEEERLASGNEHRAISERLMKLSDQIRKMEKDQRSSIKKSRTYFDQRLEFTRVLERQKELILRLEAEVRQKKCDYTTSLRNLERISDSIHEQRSIGSGSAREPPANPPPYQPTAPPPYEDDDGRYAINQETDEVIAPVLCLMRANGCADWPQRPAGIGSGVILLAQQLIGGGEKRESPTSSHARNRKIFLLHAWKLHSLEKVHQAPVVAIEHHYRKAFRIHQSHKITSVYFLSGVFVLANDRIIMASIVRLNRILPISDTLDIRLNTFRWISLTSVSLPRFSFRCLVPHLDAYGNACNTHDIECMLRYHHLANEDMESVARDRRIIAKNHYMAVSSKLPE
ncbi:unnamed protein product [Cylicocyclus nassatus]|uniref:Uncharacterized protein n=1 Tax=Cylicocyclus nassatus TaxID=53992 RepID=A0AA36HEU2_CYLNA|nr:unnamed protein product [Cylicocyclus nassatus]